jgi:hypothetical protein
LRPIDGSRAAWGNWRSTYLGGEGIREEVQEFLGGALVIVPDEEVP